MGGRLTEMFDYLQVAPEKLTERKELYCSFKITDEAKAVRGKYLRKKRLDKKDIKC